MDEFAGEKSQIVLAKLHIHFTPITKCMTNIYAGPAYGGVDFK